MRILLVNTFHYPRGGASVHVLGLAKLLRSRGHEVLHYAMRHPDSLPCPETEEYWPSYIDFPKLLRKKSLRSIVRVLRRTIYSRESADGLRRLIVDKGPFDVAHLNNILHHLTPSIIEPLREAGIPIVWTLHDYSLLCPNTNFVDNRTGRLCTVCLKGGLRFINAPLRRCKKGSFAASSMAAIESWGHRLLRVANKVDIFISPSRFLAGKFFEAGFDGAKFTVLPYFVELPPEKRFPPGDYALYVGRLSQEKGVDVLIAAWKKMPAYAVLKIAGSGPIVAELKSMASDAKNIEFLGFVETSELSGIRRRARFTIAPSICWDNFPISVQESLADGVPVLGSRIGGIPEMVISGETGELFEPGDVDDLHEKALSLWKNDEGRRGMGILARRFVHENFDPGNYCEILEGIYKKIIRSV